MTDLPPDRCDVVVVGAGILGLAVARELQRRRPGERVVVLEREDRVAAHQSGHSSGVVHAGIYYLPGSLKAKLCVAGAREMAAFCQERGVAYERCGKLIVATSEGELERLDELERRGRANQVEGLRRLDPDELRALEPHATGVAALHSPATGIADFAGVTRALADDIGEVFTGCGIEAVAPRGRTIVLRHAQGAIEARQAVFCAGAWSDRLAVLAGADPDPRIVPFRGAYLRLKPERRHLVRSLIYPVPDPALPFLGVHLTKHTSGEVLVGPTALLSPGRASYRLSRFANADLAATFGWPGTWRMMRAWWRTGAVELHHAAVRSAFVRAAARFVPELTDDDVLPAHSGIRAQALGRDGKLVDDFVFSHTERALHVRNAPSPGATSSFAIARHVANQVETL